MDGKRLRTADVIHKDRAGRAPYNFVPLPAQKLRGEPPPPGDHYDRDLLTGEIHFSMTALTEFYTRGMWGLDEFRKKKKGEQNPAPFEVAGKLRLPGSSIRGMIRTLVEILAGDTPEQVNETTLSFRAVASVPDPENKSSFEPQAHEYKRRLGLLPEQGQKLTVNAGYLYARRDQDSGEIVWEIRPATYDPETDRQWYRYRTLDKWMRKPIRFDPDGDYARISRDGSEDGWLVCSGGIPRKTKQWVVRGEDEGAPPLRIPTELVKAYKENGVTRELRDRFDYSDQTQGLPCFYTAEGGKVSGFGHTAYFRMPYKHNPTQCIPSELKLDDGEWSFAQALFGRVRDEGKKRTGARTRVFFEDAFLEGTAEVGAEKSVVLGQPQPTTYQHYVVQPAEELKDAMHWDGNYQSKGEAVIRGYKLYWHRTGRQLQSTESDKENVKSRLRPVGTGAVFGGRVRFENLRSEELGGLLEAMFIPKGLAHRLGMGKPLGLGSFHISPRAVLLTNRAERYSSFFRPGQSMLSTGYSILDATTATTCRNAFSRRHGLTRQQLWEAPRFKELKALLTCGEQQASAEWWNATRYLEFGLVETPEFQGNFNEYTHVRSPQGKPQLSKRRPLPPARQVLDFGAAIPRDERPKPGPRSK